MKTTGPVTFNIFIAEVVFILSGIQPLRTSCHTAFNLSYLLHLDIWQDSPSTVMPGGQVHKTLFFHDKQKKCVSVQR